MGPSLLLHHISDGEGVEADGRDFREVSASARPNVFGMQKMVF